MGRRGNTGETGKPTRAEIESVLPKNDLSVRRAAFLTEYVRFRCSAQSVARMAAEAEWLEAVPPGVFEERWFDPLTLRPTWMRPVEPPAPADEMSSAKSPGLPDLPPLLTAAQASLFLQIPESTLAIWRSTNRVHLPYVKLGGHVRYKREDIQAFLSDK